jgi:OOP family OmpA-OmpF porin
VNGSETDNTVPFGPRLGYRLNGLFSLEGELLVMPTQTSNGAAGLGIFGLRAQGVYYPLDESERLRPFVTLGAGVDLQVSDNDPVIDDGSVVLAHLGVGARFRLSDQFGVRADARFLLGPALDGSFSAGHGELLFSLYFSLGGGGRAAPDEPVAAKEPTPDDGDADGVPDSRDDCPRRAEDIDGHDDDDGCPESDEDVDGDGDGVLGSLDACPKDKENENGFQDDDGCPDQPPAAVAEYTGTIEGVSFKSGSARIVKGSYVILDRVAKVLSDNPDLKVVIVGHTDDRGARTKNVALSLARAQAVKDYLVTLGIAEDRLSAEGRGPDQPLEDNTTASGRSRNRRIEFQISGKLANPAGGPPKPERP